MPSPTNPTFINRTTSDYGLTSDQPAVNAHIARLSHRRRKRARVPNTTRRTFGSRLLAIHHIGGLRDDPFWSLPVENKHDAMTGFDHHFQVLCPRALSLGNYNYHQHCVMAANVLQTPMYCSSMIALNLTVQSQSQAEIQAGTAQRLSLAAMYHLNEAVAAVRECLADSERCTSDIVLATIFPLAVVHSMLNDYTGFTAHVEGVRRIVALRGGVDNLGMDGFLKVSVLGTLEQAAVLKRQHFQRVEDQAQGLIIHDDSVLVYPIQPFSDALLSKISIFPPGLASLAFESRLSLQCINFFQLFCQWFDDLRTNHKPHDSMVALGHDILAMPQLSIMERALAVAAQAYLNHLEPRSWHWSHWSTEDIVETQTFQLSTDPQLGDIDEDALTWACLIIRDTSIEGTSAWKWSDRIISSMDIDDTRLNELCSLFFARPPNKASNTEEAYIGEQGD
ncbi:hypothetical protein LTR10_022964 [Elasticomyces elasticus]|uniref:Transcription factor domain-containing protein n=1 Tax=Exophiala sideris TaxID=1016849 RepID=A0ABR0IZB9_9EURO|nr:hypothetical protein LTR10_022964 [Elasticomyces elasticus]KAK5022699.1 hypothetical protein LTS07_009922 [Exophiala sideris]KAK5027637.1 hypothetical protein LTR13_009344 [Exophiala sideris]KAK5052275.1 hypothetical protein LTR69_010037 [Exophiala sideris]KAK5177928.1 hypothetical protein LTR44_009477 [Eurotiomycetes sp. CCFEE 6388]